MTPLSTFIALIAVGLFASIPAANASAFSQETVDAMRTVHAKHRGRPGTIAHFGDSITDTMAFWAPIPHQRKNASPEMERAFETVNAHIQPECWREWKGAEFGNEGTRTAAWALERVDGWLDRLDPETVHIQFGSNDVQSFTADEFASDLRALVRACLDNGTVVILSTIPPRNGYVEKSALFAEVVRHVAADFRVPLIDLHREILTRRPNDWDGSDERFAAYNGYDVPTLTARDGVHLSHPEKYRGDYSPESLNANGYALRNYLALTTYAEVIDAVLDTTPTRDWHPKAPPLPEPTGKIVRVATVEELFDAVQHAEPNTTILIADGRYMMPRYLELQADGVTVRGESGRRTHVILDGAESQHGELFGFRACSDVTVADLTIQNIQFNGFKINSETGVQRLTIRNCVIHNIWQRGVKGVKVREQDRESTRPHNVRVEYCLFYNDRPKRYEDDDRDTAGTFGGNYVGGIDAMYAKDWVIADNVFAGIKGRTGSARGAVFLWHETEGCIVERNVIADCDTGISIGNSSKPDDVPIHATGVIVRNNFLTRTPENGIVFDYTRDCRILHNTIHDPESRLQRLIRLVHANDGLVVANNLVSGPDMRVETDSAMTIHDNTTRVVTERFVSAAEGNLQLNSSVGKVRRLPEASEDIDGEPRADPTDVGADQIGR
ncbi:MAG: right-handed parallel beta-helix repeat-containing protein [Candidatus Poribacteria bacterium]|nr:right-handed parallel beta-helix repeat-containing protein [Candidatus Poribacteria bacterium]